MFHQQVCSTSPYQIQSLYSNICTLCSPCFNFLGFIIYETLYLMELRLRVNTPNIFYNTKDFLSFFIKCQRKTMSAFAFLINPLLEARKRDFIIIIVLSSNFLYAFDKNEFIQFSYMHFGIQREKKLTDFLENLSFFI